MANEPPLPSWKSIHFVAREQRRILWIFVAGIVVMFFPIALHSPGSPSDDLSAGLIGSTVVVFATRAIMAVLVYRVTRELEARAPLLWAIGAFLPNVVGMLVLLAANQRATKYLKQRGIKVGLMGANLGPNPPPGFICQETPEVFS